MTDEFLARVHEHLAGRSGAIHDDLGVGEWVHVESLTIVHDGPWRELEIAFRLDPPDEPRFADVSPRGTVRCTFDAEWLVLSRYDDPEVYAGWLAPRVAARAHGVVARDLAPRRPVVGEEQLLAAAPPAETLWAELLSQLEGYGEVAVVGPGRIEVHAEDGDIVTVVVTPEQWRRAWALGGYGDDLRLDEVLGPRQDDETYLVFHGDGFTRSVREQLPPVRGTAWERRVEQLRRDDPDAVGWFAYGPD